MPPANAASGADAPSSAPSEARRQPKRSYGWLDALASLRLTVVLFALTIVLVFVGTLAQVDHDIWFVVNGDGWDGGYFRVWFAQFEYQAFNRLLLVFTKGEARPIEGSFWFPGGLLLGSLMFANLLAAHALRFKAAARGGRLTLGLGVLAAGIAATVGVIGTGMDQSLKGQLSSEFCDGLWQALRALLAGVALGGVWWSMNKVGKLRPAEWWLATALTTLLLGVAVYLYANPSVGPDDAGMRIVWELTKSGGAAVLTFLGCWLVFKQRAGIVLLHAGVGLLMIGELVTHLSAVEGQMRIPEGATVNYVDDIRSFELAVSTDEGDATRVTAVPASMLTAAVKAGEPIRHDDLPFDLRVTSYEGASRLVPVRGDNPATAGAGLETMAEPAKSVSGVSRDAGVNLPSAYVEPLDKESGESLGVWLVSSSFQIGADGRMTGLRPQPIAIDDQTHEVELRFERTYKPYSITLNDFRFDKYVGTEMAKNYSSDVVLTDPSRGVERPVKIWMNNPLRYAGDTIYQSSFDTRGPVEATVLQVVTNGGWMIPYVSCVFVGLGMLAHFLITLGRFARRRVEEAKRKAAKLDGPAADPPGWLSPELWKRPTVWGPALAALVTIAYLGGKARPVTDEPNQMAVQRFGSLPVAEGGRIKPIDTLARHTLQHFSARQEVLPADEDEDAPRVPATEWLLDTLSGRDGWRDHRVFRIENLELLDALDLEPRPGSFRYSYAEVMADPGKTEGLLDKAHQQYLRIKQAEQGGPATEPLTLVQDKTLALRQKIMSLRQLVTAFGTPNFSSTEDEGIREQLMRAQSMVQVLRRSGAVRVVPPGKAEGEWTTLFENELMNLLRRTQGLPPEPAGVAWSRALVAYADEDAEAFADRLTDLEAALEKYQRSLQAAPEALASLAPAERLDAGKVRFEHAFSAFSPFYYCAVMYLVAFVLACCGWLGQGGATLPRTLGRCATAVIVVTLLVHTFALISRIYISGRPPVTNLYTTAIFIGWGAVLLGMAIEAIYRMGLGSAAASAIGFATLVVAHYLSLDGDTFTVLQAVLDTQFWLATHVVCVTFGYATVYIAGAFGILYLLMWLLDFDRELSGSEAGRVVSGIVYGMLCFAMLFSFVGTVLGGLWADDSWGRFWGWDPKENGALIIVLWNALVLHARWGKLIGPLGLATFAVFGNIVTTWSWFGVNELGVGLHAYGGNDSPTAQYMLYFIASQLVICLIGLVAMAMPKRARAKA
ncbi:Cytochrome c biogenesis protein CcsA [Planctomycetes bacterium MalM25]|nr:Cytochrome c biogenesis protein CcsA [Planctomycetes bacterium MalM25]